MRLGPLKVPEPNALLELPAMVVRLAEGLDDLVGVLREDLEAGGRRDEIRDLRSVAEDLRSELQEIRGELGWLRANLESIQERVPGLSPPGPG